MDRAKAIYSKDKFKRIRVNYIKIIKKIVEETEEVEMKDKILNMLDARIVHLRRRYGRAIKRARLKRQQEEKIILNDILTKKIEACLKKSKQSLNIYEVYEAIEAEVKEGELTYSMIRIRLQKLVNKDKLTKERYFAYYPPEMAEVMGAAGAEMVHYKYKPKKGYRIA